MIQVSFIITKPYLGGKNMKNKKPFIAINYPSFSDRL